MTLEILNYQPNTPPQPFYDIGRPMDKTWLKIFDSVFRDKLPPKVDVDFQVRSQPGVVYAIRDTLRRAAARRKQLTGQDVAQPINTGVLLTDAAIVEPLALTKLSVPFWELYTSSVRRRIYIRAAIGDMACSTYSGFVIDGEKHAIWQALIPEEDKQAHFKKGYPKHNITLSSLDSSVISINKLFLTRLRENLGDEIELEPLSEMMSPTPKQYPFD